MERPKPFDGTLDEKRANYQTHRWGTLDGEEWACWECEAKVWHIAAQWPCGASIPRETIDADTPEEQAEAMFGPGLEVLASFARD